MKERKNFLKSGCSAYMQKDVSDKGGSVFLPTGFLRQPTFIGWVRKSFKL